MSSGKASVFSPAYSPIFSPDATRGATRVRLQGTGYGGGGDPEFPFQWGWPGLVNYSAPGLGIPSILGHSLVRAFWTLNTAPTSGSIEIGVYVNAVLDSSFTFSANGSGAAAISVAAGSVVGVYVIDFASGDAEGLWFGLTTVP